MAQLDEAEVKEVFKLFDQEGGNTIKIREIGTVMRSLGLSPPEAALKEMREEARKADTYGSDKVDYEQFQHFVKRAQEMSSKQDSDITKEVGYVKTGMLHFFDKVPAKELREAPPDTVKLTDLRHLMMTMGEKLSEDELEELMKDLRSSCEVVDGRVKFEDFVKMIMTN